MLLLIKLLLAHLLGDFIFQPSKWVEQKELKKVKAWQLYVHVLIHGTLISLLVQNTNFIWPIVIITISHGFIDAAKLLLQKTETKRTWFVVDQTLHLMVLFGIWFYIENPIINVAIINSADFLLTTAAIVFITTPSSVIIKMFISRWTPNLPPPNSSPLNSVLSTASVQSQTSQDDTTSLQNAGKIIGILERLFVFAFVITGNWEAIGFLIAAKSVFRFGDLKEAKDLKLTEYVLIGTLLSFGLAIATGILLLILTKTEALTENLLKLIQI